MCVCVYVCVCVCMFVCLFEVFVYACFAHDFYHYFIIVTNPFISPRAHTDPAVGESLGAARFSIAAVDCRVGFTLRAVLPDGTSAVFPPLSACPHVWLHAVWSRDG